MFVDRTFTPADLAEIERAVAAAEAGSSGEIVPYVVDACDGYPGAFWAAAALGAMAAPLAAVAAHAAFGLWGGYEPLWVALPPLAGAGLGGLAALVSARLRRFLVPDATLDRRVETRAAAAFVAEEVFATRERTGILLFVALFEHKVVVLADTGIHAQVDPTAWREVAGGIAGGIAAGRPGAAVAEGVRRCGEILAAHRVVRRPDDRDELPDAVRREER